MLFQLKKRAHRRYKYAVHHVKRREGHIEQVRLPEALLNDPSRNFWSEVHRFSGSQRASSVPVIDGVSGSENNAKLWRESLGSYVIPLMALLLPAYSRRLIR